ncbi:hypothetical protein CAL25_17970 [Bordetella genomosp. 5]|uniref:RiboL-PSP-HEPN domain-containing protein n=2 Tax=Bordetella genomosp. 5 TaxID=1395608 RepID=A0A261TBW7_9BORD|nr:hypothetical protein CAL25_17970 [Bordetella genomosp. 5]
MATLRGALIAQTAATDVDDLLRAEWAARVAALDLYIHELVAERMVAIFAGQLAEPKAFSKLSLPVSVCERIRSATSAPDAVAAFDLEIRRQLTLVTFQFPDQIADGIRMTSDVELWKAIAQNQGATTRATDSKAKAIRANLKLIVERRNKIVHEGDLAPSFPRAPWPIGQVELANAAAFLLALVTSIELVVT